MFITAAWPSVSWEKHASISLMEEFGNPFHKYSQEPQGCFLFFAHLFLLAGRMRKEIWTLIALVPILPCPACLPVTPRFYSSLSWWSLMWRVEFFWERGKVCFPSVHLAKGIHCRGPGTTSTTALWIVTEARSEVSRCSCSDTQSTSFHWPSMGLSLRQLPWPWPLSHMTSSPLGPVAISCRLILLKPTPVLLNILLLLSLQLSWGVGEAESIFLSSCKMHMENSIGTGLNCKEMHWQAYLESRNRVSCRADFLQYLWFYFSELLQSCFPQDCTFSFFSATCKVVAPCLMSTPGLTQRNKRAGCFWKFC